MLWRALSEVARLYGVRISHKDLEAQSASVPEIYMPEVAANTLMEYGFRVKVISVEKIEDLGIYNKIPLIIKFKKNQWCIFEQNENGKIIIKSFSKNIDTSTIEISYSLDEINKNFEKVIILVEYDIKEFSNNEKINTENNQWFWSVFFKLKSYYGDCIVAAILINILALAGSMFSMNVYDRIIPNAAINSLWALSIGVILAGLIEFGLRTYRAYILDDAGKKSDLLLSSSIFKKSINLNFNQRPPSSGHWAGQIREFESVREFVSSGTIVILTDLPFTFLFFFVIYLIGGSIVLIPLLISILIVIAGFITQLPIKKSVEQYQYENNLKQTFLMESLERIETIEALSAKSIFLGKWERICASSSRSAMASRLASAFSTNISQYFQQLASVIVIISGVYLILNNRLTVGALIACSILSSRALTPLSQISGLIARWQNTKISYKNLNKLMQLEDQSAVIKNKISIHDIKKEILIKDVGFTFGKNNNIAIDIKSLELKKNEIIALMGPVGSGKSTVLKIIAGLYKPTNGKILIDNIDLEQISPADWRSLVSWVSQDAVLFRGTLRENLLISSPKISDERFLQIINICNLQQLIESSPLGLDMPIGESGNKLSGGQKHMVALARALMSDSILVLLDEPTCFLDLPSENLLINNLKNEFKNKIIIIATHRVAPLNIADRLIVLDKGSIVADGPKQTILNLIKDGQIYRNSKTSQMSEEVIN